MSRLESYRQRQFRKKVIVFVVGLMLLVIFVFTVGFNLLIKTSLFVDTIGNKNSSTDQSNRDAFFGSLNVDTPPIATNSAIIVVSGSVDGYDVVEISINDKKVKTLKNKSSFNEVVGDLRKGQNELKVLAKSQSRTEDVKRQVFEVLYKDEKPKLDISEPTDGTTTDATEIKIVGKTDPDITIRINDSPVVVDVQGNFTTFSPLKDGENKFHIEATDAAGNTQVKDLIVHFEK